MKLLLVAFAVSTAACTDATRPESIADGEFAATSALDAEPPISQLAGAIARGLASADARRTILAAMRASTEVEHQLVLGNYLRSPEGYGLLGGSAATLGIDEAEFLDRLATLEEAAQLVISVPFREQRLAWRGTADIGIAGSRDPNILDFVVHEPGGLQEAVTDLNQVRRYDAFFYVRPRESWGTRIGRQADGPGPVIQDPVDGEQAMTWTYEIEGRPPVRVDYGRWDSYEEAAHAVEEALRELVPATEMAMRVVRDPNVTHSPTVVDDFMLKRGDPVGTSEVKITVAYTNSHGSRIRGSLRWDGIDTNVWYFRDDPHRNELHRRNILPVSPKLGGATFAVAAVETDAIFDDNLGRREFGYLAGGRSIGLWGITVNLVW